MDKKKKCARVFLRNPIDSKPHRWLIKVSITSHIFCTPREPLPLNSYGGVCKRKCLSNYVAASRNRSFQTLTGFSCDPCRAVGRKSWFPQEPPSTHFSRSKTGPIIPSPTLAQCQINQSVGGIRRSRPLNRMPTQVTPTLTTGKTTCQADPQREVSKHHWEPAQYKYQNCVRNSPVREISQLSFFFCGFATLHLVHKYLLPFSL